MYVYIYIYMLMFGRKMDGRFTYVVICLCTDKVFFGHTLWRNPVGTQVLPLLQYCNSVAVFHGFLGGSGAHGAGAEHGPTADGCERSVAHGGRHLHDSAGAQKWGRFCWKHGG